MKKEIRGFTNYFITDEGQIWSERTHQFLSLKQHNTYGYPIVVVRDDNKKKRTLMPHRLVGIYFIPNPNNWEDIHHIDGNKDNNNIDNLLWISHKEHCALHSHFRKG